MTSIGVAGGLEGAARATPFRQLAARGGVLTRRTSSRPLRPTNALDALDWTEIRIGFDF